MFAASMSAESPACQLCDGSGFLETSEAVLSECSCRVEARRRARFESTLGLVPHRFRGCTRDSWRGPWPIEDWRAVDAADPWAVLLIGPPGTGKTHAATALWLELVAAGGREMPLWLSAEEAVEQAKREIDEGVKTGRLPIRTRLRESDILLLDDVGRERATPFAIELVRSVLHHRHAWRRPTIVTSNAERLEDFDVFDPALTSRLREGTLVYALDGADRRRQRRTA